MEHVENKKQMIDTNSTISITNVNVLNNQIKRQKLPHLKIKQIRPNLMLSIGNTFKIKDTNRMKI